MSGFDFDSQTYRSWAPCVSPEKWGPLEDSLDFVWGLYVRGSILRPSLFTIDIILKVPAADELFNFILKCDTLLCGVTNIFVVSIIFVLIPL